MNGRYPAHHRAQPQTRIPRPVLRSPAVPGEFVKFALVGAGTWVVDTVVFLLLKSTLLEAKPVTAKVIAVLVATAMSYVLNREWSFRTRGGRPRVPEAGLFFLISAIAVGVYSAPLWISRYLLELRVPEVSLLTQNLADFLAGQVIGVLLGMIFRWWAFRRFVFPRVHLRVGDQRAGAGEQGVPASAAGSSALADPAVPVLSVVIPTRNERDTIEACLARVAAALAEPPRAFEVIVVDDSDDDTPALLGRIAARSPYLRVLHRAAPHRVGGLSGALTAGFELACGEVVVVMDADLQHPPEVLPQLLDQLHRHGADVCVASRYIEGGSAGGLDGRWRRIVSLAARAVVHLLIPATRSISDPCGGFFAVRRGVLRGAELEAEGFKILVEILAKTPWMSHTEIPYQFARRGGGSSNFGTKEIARFARHMSRLARAPRRLDVPASTDVR
jgi:putative flippase GtrA